MRLRLFGYELVKAVPNLSPPDGSSGGWGGWWPVVRESYAGAWQQNVEVRANLVLAYHAVFSCITLISQDVGKLPWRLMAKSGDGIWQETESAAFSPFLKRPNHYQNPLQFRETWITSKLRSGNTYVLKQRDARGVVIAGYVLDPGRVKPLVSPDGMVFYELNQDNLSDIADTIIVPQSEIFHDRMNCLFHPLVGISPIFACGLAAMQGLAAQNGSTKFFQNMSRPGGLLIAPGPIDPAKAATLQTQWNTGFSGDNAGKVAVLGDGMKYEALALTAEETQLIEQLKWTADVVCSCFHVPPFKIGVGTTPTYQNAEILNQIYYSDCLQGVIEQMESVLDYGLGLDMKKDGVQFGIELNIDELLRMDSATKVTTLGEGVNRALYSPNEARRRLNLPPVEGGASPLMQVQNYSLSALAKRDAGDDPFGKATAPAPAEPAEDDAEEDEEEERAYEAAILRKIEQRRKAA